MTADSHSHASFLEPPLVDPSQEESSLNLPKPSSLKGVPFGRYLLFNRLNVGGMAEVFLAKAFATQGLERIVAIKRILPHTADDPEFIRMFIDEAKLSVLLNHPNIAQTLELGRIGSTFFISMEYVSGIDLRYVWEFCRDKNELPLESLIYIMLNICHGLDYAHRKKDANQRPLGIVHRDISPQNIMIGFDGHVKIIDFGIAKAQVRASNTKNGILKGKFAYMSPEQVAGLEIDSRSDIFSLGTLFYELITHTRLFKAESDYATLERVRHAELFPPRLVCPHIPLGIERIVLKALQKNRDKRYQSAAEMADDLTQYLIQSNIHFTASHLAQILAQQFHNKLRKEKHILQTIAQICTPQMLFQPLAPQEAENDPKSSIKNEETYAKHPTEAQEEKAHEKQSETQTIHPLESVSQKKVRPFAEPTLSIVSDANLLASNFAELKQLLPDLKLEETKIIEDKAEATFILNEERSPIHPLITQDLPYSKINTQDNQTFEHEPKKNHLKKQLHSYALWLSLLLLVLLIITILLLW